MLLSYLNSEFPYLEKFYTSFVVSLSVYNNGEKIMNALVSDFND